MKFIIKIFFLIFILVKCLYADIVLVPTPYIIPLQDGKFYFKIIDAGPELIGLFRKGYPKQYLYYNCTSIGHLYRVTQNNVDSLIWKTELLIGWYGYFSPTNTDFYISLGNWPKRSFNDSQNNMLIAFFKKGKLLKSYSTKYFIKDTSKIKQSVSHFRVLKKVIGFKDNYIFSIITIDNWIYNFDIRNGELINSKKHHFFNK